MRVELESQRADLESIMRFFDGGCQEGVLRSPTIIIYPLTDNTPADQYPILRFGAGYFFQPNTAVFVPFASSLIAFCVGVRGFVSPNTFCILRSFGIQVPPLSANRHKVAWFILPSKSSFAITRQDLPPMRFSLRRCRASKEAVAVGVGMLIAVTERYSGKDSLGNAHPQPELRLIVKAGAPGES